MVNIDKRKFEEFHDNEKEYCRESGPLNSKKIEAPSAVAKALVMSLFTAAAVYTVAFAQIFNFVPSLVHVIDNTAIIETMVENIPENSKVIFELFNQNELDKVIRSGEIDDLNNQLHFDDLEYDTEYIVRFYLRDNDKKEFLDIIKFKVDNKKTDSDVFEEPEVPEEPTVPEEPSVPEEPTVPENPIIPEEPSVPEEPTIPEDPIVPEEPENPEIPNEEDIINILVEEPKVNNAEIYIDNDVAKGYVISESHTFTQVLSGEYTINVTQNNETLSYVDHYDESTQTLTVTFDGNPVNYGETINSNVSLTYKDIRVESTNTITAPKLNEITLDMIYNQDGTYTYQINLNGIEPSIGTVNTNITLYTDLYEVLDTSDIQTFNTDTVSFSKEYTTKIDAPGQSLTALVFADLVWSLDTTDYYQSVETLVDYRVPDISSLSFDNIHESDYGYIYTVNAKFANLVNVIPQSVEFYRQIYNPVFNEVFDEELVMTLDASQITLDDSSNILASYSVTDEEALQRESSGHNYRVVLTYLDSLNELRTIEVNDHIEPLSPVFNHLNSIMWQENGITYADYEMVFSISPTYSPKGASLLNLNAMNWEILSSELEFTETHGYVRGQMSTDMNYELSLNVYLDWLESSEEDYIYTGCGGGSYIESLLTNQNLIPNSTNSGYDSVTEEFTFVNGNNLLLEYTQHYVLVTLADGSTIKVTETQEDPTGLVTVNWNDNNNVVVSVNQTNVSLGQLTTVDLIQEIVREEEMMLGLVNSYTYRCMSKY